MDAPDLDTHTHTNPYTTHSSHIKTYDWLIVCTILAASNAQYVIFFVLAVYCVDIFRPKENCSRFKLADTEAKTNRYQQLTNKTKEKSA